MLIPLTIKDFDEIFQIMEESFPKDEYRTRDGQKALFVNPVYRVYGIRNQESQELKGFAAVWEFADMVFLEHFAVSSRFRNGGLGAEILKNLQNLSEKRICLEVELPQTELAKRRIGFYERNGFVLNHFPYMQPALAKGQKEIPLMIMTSGGNLDAAGFCRIRDLLYHHVYQVL